MGKNAIKRAEQRLQEFSPHIAHLAELSADGVCPDITAMLQPSETDLLNATIR